MKFTLFPAKDRKTISWASGTSTEIYIYPQDGDFVSRDFTFRISTATVEAESSTFTFFEGITRQLMILKGELELVHEGRYSKHLKAYDQDTFFGEWPTTSIGKVTDFNLMLKNGATGNLKHSFKKGDSSWTIEPTENYTFIYLAEGKATINDVEVASGDLVQIHDELTISNDQNNHWISIMVKL